MAHHISYYVSVSHVAFAVCLFSTLQPDILHVDFDFTSHTLSHSLSLSLLVTAGKVGKEERIAW